MSPVPSIHESPTIDSEILGERIRELRAMRALSLRELSALAHVSAAHLSYVERGERAPTPQIVGAVAKALGVGVSVLYGQPYIKMLQPNRLDAMLAPIAGRSTPGTSPTKTSGLRPSTKSRPARAASQPPDRVETSAWSLNSCPT